MKTDLATIRNINQFYFVSGGTLPGGVPSYVERKADRELLEALLTGEFCYVLDTRQVGKSSLMVRTAQRLQKVGKYSAILDISSIGENLTQDQWYFGLLTNLAVAFDLEEEAEEYWLAHSRLSSVQRWFAALRNVLLLHLQAPLIVFVDEIDAVRKLPFSVDEFFAAIRECHNRRTSYPDAYPITFCLMGVATPSDLIQDVRTTPFNIGRRIELHDFSLPETSVLAPGLPGDSKEQQAQIERVWYWTAGHPYLTQKFCQSLANRERPSSSREIDALCRYIFVCRQAQEEEDNLKFVSRQVLFDEATRADILTLYRRIRKATAFRSEDASEALVKRLLLSGLVCTTPDTRNLVIRNRIYALVFDAGWVRANMPEAEVRRQRIAMRQGYVRATLLWAGFAGLAWMTLYQSGRAASESGRAEAALNQIKEFERKRKGLEQQNTSTQVELSLRREELKGESLRTRNLLHKSQVMAQQLDSQHKALDQVNLTLKARQASFVELNRKDQQLIDDINKMMAPLAMTGHGYELDAIHFGLSSAQPALAKKVLPPRQVMQVLVDAVCAGIVRRLRIVHAGSVCDAMLSPDNSRLVTVGAGRYACIWDAKSGKLVQRLEVLPVSAHRPVINSVYFSKDGRWILTASNDHRICLWDANRRGSLQTTPLLDLPVSPSPLTTAALSEDARRLVTTAADNTVDLWELSALDDPSKVVCRHLRTFKGSTADAQQKNPYVWAVDISHNGKYVAAGGSYWELFVWDTDTGQRIPGGDHVHGGIIRSVRFNAWSNHLISAGDDRSARLWAIDRNVGQRNEYRGQFDTVYDAEDGGADLYVATGGKDRSVRIWTFNPGLAPLYVLNTHRDTVYSNRFSRDTHYLTTASADHSAELWQFTVPTFSASNGYTKCVAFSPDGQNVICSRGDGMATIWNWRTGAHLWHCTTAENTDRNVACRAAVFSHSGKWVATASEDGAVRLWEVGTYPQSELNTKPTLALQGRTGKAVYTLAYSPDDRRVLTAGADGNVILWNSRTGQAENNFHDASGSASSAFFAPDGRHVVTASSDGSVRIWSIASPQQPLQVLLPPGRTLHSKGNGEAPMSAVFSPDGRYILSADRDHHAYLWDAISGKFLRMLEGHGGTVNVAAFSPNGKWIATGSSDRTVCFWDASEVVSQKNPKPLYFLRNHAADVEWLDFSPDSNWITTASRDGTCRVYPATFTGMIEKAHELLQAPYREIKTP